MYNPLYHYCPLWLLISDIWHCRYLAHDSAAKRARERQCDKTDENDSATKRATTFQCRPFCHVALSLVLSHCRVRDIDSAKCPISATILSRCLVIHSSVDCDRHARLTIENIDWILFSIRKDSTIFLGPQKICVNKAISLYFVRTWGKMYIP